MNRLAQWLWAVFLASMGLGVWVFPLLGAWWLLLAVARRFFPRLYKYL